MPSILQFQFCSSKMCLSEIMMSVEGAARRIYMYRTLTPTPPDNCTCRCRRHTRTILTAECRLAGGVATNRKMGVLYASYLRPFLCLRPLFSAFSSLWVLGERSMIPSPVAQQVLVRLLWKCIFIDGILYRLNRYMIVVWDIIDSRGLQWVKKFRAGRASACSARWGGAGVAPVRAIGIQASVEWTRTWAGVWRRSDSIEHWWHSDVYMRIRSFVAAWLAGHCTPVGRSVYAAYSMLLPFV